MCCCRIIFSHVKIKISSWKVNVLSLGAWCPKLGHTTLLFLIHRSCICSSRARQSINQCPHPPQIILCIIKDFFCYMQILIRRYTHISRFLISRYVILGGLVMPFPFSNCALFYKRFFFMYWSKTSFSLIPNAS